MQHPAGTDPAPDRQQQHTAWQQHALAIGQQQRGASGRRMLQHHRTHTGGGQRQRQYRLQVATPVLAIAMQRDQPRPRGPDSGPARCRSTPEQGQMRAFGQALEQQRRLRGCQCPAGIGIKPICDANLTGARIDRHGRHSMPATPLPAFDDNYIWCLNEEDQGQWLVVDPGQAEPVLAYRQDRPPLAILLTHHHGDHVGGVKQLLQHWPQVPVYGPDDPRMPAGIRPLTDGQRLTIGPWQVQVLAVPGHTASHLAYLVADHLFCGDTLFSLGCGRMFEGTPAQMLASLDRLAALPAHTLVCCGHEYTLANAAFALAVEPHNAALQHRLKEAQAMRISHRPSLPSTIGSELDCNPFLRTAVATVATAVAATTDSCDDRVAVFAALRRWKDGFTA